MNYAPLNPAMAVVLFADLQAGILELTATTEASKLRRAVSALAKLAKLYEMPAVVTCAPAASVVVTPEIAATLGEQPSYVRKSTDAFLDAPTRAAIAATQRQTLLIAGVATEIIVQHSALSGMARGYNVQLVMDACGGLSARTEEAALRRLTQAGVVTTSIASLAGQLAGDLSQSKGQQALGIFYEMISG
jgi:nicotinamidase-related amidase